MRTEQVWRNDFEKVSAALEAAGAIVQLNDGSSYVDEKVAHPAIVSTYRGLVGIGYACGWLA